MKVLIVNTFDRGGAANSCFRLHLGLLEENVESKALVLRKTKNYRYTFQFQTKNHKYFIDKIVSRIKKNNFFRSILTTRNELFLKNRAKELEMFSFPSSKYDITKTDLYKEADIINLHWVAGFLDYESFFKKNRKPVVWTLHDMNPFSGGEHYNESLFGINKEGKPLKREFNFNEKEVFKKNLVLKLRALTHVKEMTIVSPSKWLQDEARKSSLFKDKDIHLIPYGLNTDVFKTRNKKFARDFLGIPENKKVVLFIADSIDNNRKGFKYLENALKKINNSNILLCSVGALKTKFNGLKNILHLGSIQDEKIMSLVYSASDVFVIPSLMDNLPNTVLESLLCGTPVIGFPIGGIPDMVRHTYNGWIADGISVEALVNAISSFLDKGILYNKEDIRKDAVSKYDEKVQAKLYIELFNSISLAERKSEKS